MEWSIKIKYQDPTWTPTADFGLACLILFTSGLNMSPDAKWSALSTGVEGSTVSCRWIAIWSLQPPSEVIWDAYCHIFVVRKQTVSTAMKDCRWSDRVILNRLKQPTSERGFVGHLCLKANATEGWLNKRERHPSSSVNDVWNLITSGHWRHIQYGRCKSLCFSAVGSRWMFTHGNNRALGSTLHDHVFRRMVFKRLVESVPKWGDVALAACIGQHLNKKHVVFPLICHLCVYII